MRRFPLIGLALVVLLAYMPLPLTEAQRAQQNATATSATAAAAIGPVKPLTPASASTMAAAREAAQKYINAPQLKEWLYFIASDAMAGRDTPSKGLDDTAKFIADHLAKWKIKPAGDNGSYFQKIALKSYRVDPSQTSAELNGQALKYGSDFLAGTVSGTASGPLVYAGHGYRIKSKNIDAYQGIDVRDKIVVVASSVLPAGVARGELKGKAGEGDWEDAESFARKNGARGIIRIPRNFERTWRFGRALAERDTYQVERFIEEEGAQPTSLTMIPSAATINAIFAGERRSGEVILKGITEGNAGEAFALDPNKKMSFTVTALTKSATTQNVIGVLEGSDRNLKNEYVALGAHYDHVGVGRPDKNGDTIYNGADDDGSGTIGVLAIAEAFARGPRPKRSILFIWHCAEEKGLWGSEYFTRFPTVPLKQIVVQLNMDMIGRSKQAGDTIAANKELSGPNEIYVIGSKEMSTQLGEVSERINRSYLNVSFNYLYDDPNDRNRFFYRSDHFNYARNGIPIIFYFDGVHEDYHRPSDSADKIDYQKMERVTRTVFLTGSELANTSGRPLVDKPLSAERMGR